MVTLVELRDRPLVYVDDLERPVIADADRHHFERVLRVRHGDPIVVGDGRGGWRPARFATEPEPTGEGGRIAPPLDLVTVAFAPVKGERAEWFAQKLTEIGVDRIAPVLSERGVVRWNQERAQKQLARMETVTREACLQSRRLHLPAILPVTPLDTFLDQHAEAVLADPGGLPIQAKHRTVVVGPEGGFSETERAGRAAVTLPGNVLRATTAAIVAGAIVCGLRDGQIGASPS